MTRLYLRIALCILIFLMACSSPPRRTEDYKIALVSVKPDQEGIYVINSDASGKTLLFPDSNAQLFSTSWSPDGEKIALFLARIKEDADIIANYRISHHFPLYEIDVASGKETRLLDIPVSSFRWSPDGRYILYFSSYEDSENYQDLEEMNSAMYILNLQTGEQKRLTPLGKNCCGTFSPDGTQLVYSLKTDQSSDIYIMNLDGNNNRRLTEAESINLKPAWSPDGKSIAYISTNLPGAQNTIAGIYSIDPAGTNNKLVNPLLAFSLAWSPDSTSLLAQWENGISVMGADGKKIKNITTESGRPLNAVFTPDGKKIVLRSRNLNLSSTDLDGTHMKIVTYDKSVTSYCLSPLLSKP